MVDRAGMLLSAITTFRTFWIIEEVDVYGITEKLTPIRLNAVQHKLFAQRF